jgi:Concanavalin A-like lectin/glucanases superfamily/Sulfotransferase family
MGNGALALKQPQKPKLRLHDRPAKAHELIMVMGVQRSGTSVLYSSLATDERLSAFPEEIDSSFYYAFRLRPVGELAPLIARSAGRILLKPISETFVRSLVQLADEFRTYPIRFVWIYRDPVNVLHSMQRQKWIAPQDIAKPDHLLAWHVRNQYAIQFHRQSPEQIAIVRYEDLCLDPMVFLKLTDWLGLNCESLFHNDSVSGRKHVPYRAQRAIEARTSRTLRALNAARRFKAGLTCRLKSTVSRFADRAAVGDASPGAACTAIHPSFSPSSAPAHAPSEVDGLYFWLNAAAICQCNAALSKPVMEIGPKHMLAPEVENGPYCFLSLNLRGTFYYPLGKMEERRRRGGSGTLVFGAENDWNFFFDRSGFTVFALFRPNPPPKQEDAILFRVGAQFEASPAFCLQWDARLNSSKAALMTAAAQKIVVAARPQTHPRQEWALVNAQYTGGAAGEFSIAVNGNAGDSTHLARSSDVPNNDNVLQIGGCSAERESLFYGEIAELIVFRRSLSSDETSAVARHLVETHRL